MCARVFDLQRQDFDVGPSEAFVVIATCKGLILDIRGRGLVCQR